MVRSRSGETFRVLHTVHAVQDEAARFQRPFLRNRRMRNTKTILVVDDSRVARMMLKHHVHSRYPHWTVEEASSGEEAIEKARAVSPSLMLLDVNMEGMGGLSAAEELRRQHPDATITVLTANIQDATRNKAASIGVGFMTKPVSVDGLYKMIDDLEAANG